MKIPVIRLSDPARRAIHDAAVEGRRRSLNGSPEMPWTTSPW